MKYPAIVTIAEEPRLRYTTQVIAVLNLRIEESDEILTFWEHDAERIVPKVYKGFQMSILAGRESFRIWTDKNGDKHEAKYITVKRWRL